MLRTAERANERLDAAGRRALPDGLSPHALRRSFASWLIAEGEAVAYVMDQLGHTDPSMTVGSTPVRSATGRRSARSRRRLEALAGDADRAATGTGAPADVSQVVGELAA